jgi:UDPglucose 6-dehydrogenase
MRISVIGCGYVGLVAGACLAEAGHDVVCLDKDSARIAILKSGQVPFYEPNLDRLIRANCQEGRLRFTTDTIDAVRFGDAIFICVGTPPRDSGEADLSAIDSVARQIAIAAESPKLVIEKSTVPAHTGKHLQRALALYGRNGHGMFRVASNPEFLREGTAVGDFFHPDRIVLGVEDQATELQLLEIYRPILNGQFRCPVHAGSCPERKTPFVVVTTINGAELVKHASNSFLALKISYANLLADYCEQLDADVADVCRAIGLDPRIGPDFLRPGLGYGGYCLPKDLQAFMHLGERAGINVGLLREIDLVNKNRIEVFLQKVRHALWVVQDKQVGVLGLSFKAETDDIRFSPALEVIRRLRAEGARVTAYDPQAMGGTQEVFPDITYARDPYEVACDAEALLILTPWEEFRELNWSRVGNLMARPLIIDGRNLLVPSAMRELGFEIYSVGRPDLGVPVHLEQKTDVSVVAPGPREAVPLQVDSIISFYDAQEVRSLKRPAEGPGAV